MFHMSIFTEIAYKNCAYLLKAKWFINFGAVLVKAGECSLTQSIY